MASANRVTSSSLSLTLPISCQICLGKVKEPVVCPNQHVFCSPCLDLWLQTNRYCPTCRTPINHEQPFKKILGSIDLQVNSDTITKIELRRTRLELIRKEYEDDLQSLQNTIERLKAENKRLHERLSEQDKTISALHLSVNTQGKDSNSGLKPPTPDLDMLLKLTAKLQEASMTYEQLKNDMLKTNEDNKRLKEENENLLRETTRLKDDALFTKSPQRFSHYSMTALQTKVSQYEKEILQLKKALTRSDGYIDDLNARIDGRTPEPGRERASSSAESYQKQSSTIDGSRRSSSVSLEGVNTNGASPSQQTIEENHDDPLADDSDRPTMVSVTNFQPSSTTSHTTISQTRTSTEDALTSPLAEAASAIEAADQWLKAAASKADPTTGVAPPDVFYPGGDLTSHRLDSKLGMGSSPVDRFPASRQLMMLSERLSRQRDPGIKLDFAQSAPSPSSSDGGKVVPKTLDFSDMMGETGSINGDSPRMTPRLDSLSPNISYDASSSLSAMASCVYNKFKNEQHDTSDAATQAKKIKLERDDMSGFQ